MTVNEHERLSNITFGRIIKAKEQFVVRKDIFMHRAITTLLGNPDIKFNQHISFTILLFVSFFYPPSGIDDLDRFCLSCLGPLVLLLLNYLPVQSFDFECT